MLLLTVSSNPSCSGVHPNWLLTTLTLSTALAGTRPWGEGNTTTHTSTLTGSAAENYNWQYRESALPISAFAALAGILPGCCLFSPVESSQGTRQRKASCWLVILQLQQTDWGQMPSFSVGPTQQQKPLRECRESTLQFSSTTSGNRLRAGICAKYLEYQSVMAPDYSFNNKGTRPRVRQAKGSLHLVSQPQQQGTCNLQRRYPESACVWWSGNISLQDTKGPFLHQATTFKIRRHKLLS